MLENLTLIFVCQLAGEFFVTALGLPVPGPVAGMVLLFGYLLVRGEVSAPLAGVGDGLLASLSLLFVPAGVGVMLHLKLLEKDWIVVSVALVISTLCAIAVTAQLMVWLSRTVSTQGPTDDSQSGNMAQGGEPND